MTPIVSGSEIASAKVVPSTLTPAAKKAKTGTAKPALNGRRVSSALSQGEII